MKNIIFILICFLFYSYCGYTDGQCMDSAEKDIWSLSNSHSLISGYNFPTETQRRGNAAITVGIVSGVGEDKEHAYLAFEYFNNIGNIRLEGVDLKLRKGDKAGLFDRTPGNSNVRSKWEVLQKFVGYDGKAKECSPNYKKIVSFIVPKYKALDALKKVKEEEVDFSYTAHRWDNGKEENNKKVYNCCSYIFHVLKCIGINLPKEKFFMNYADTQRLKKAIEDYQPPKGIWKLTPPIAQYLFENAQEIEKEKEEEKRQRRQRIEADTSLNTMCLCGVGGLTMGLWCGLLWCGFS